MGDEGRRPSTAGAITGTASPFVGEIETITESDEQLAAILEEAELPPLLPALAYSTGDMSLLVEHLRPDPMLGALPQAGLTPEQQAEIRERALAALIRFRDGGCVPAPVPGDADVLRILEFAVAGSEMGPYLPLLEEELAHRGEDRRAPTWHKADVAPDADFSVLVIGAGMSGLLAARRLDQAGVPFLVVDKDDDVGGTWWENGYPGCRVDNPNHNYSYSFAQRHDWPLHYSTQPVLHGYFRDCTDVFGLRDRIRFGTEVLAADWSEAAQRWAVRVRTAEGEQTLHAQAVISAVGQLNRPKLPDIPGRDDFAGPSWHSARWRSDVPLAGKRVAVIGTGASAMQLIPEVAKEAGELVVFQRTPAWLGPTPDYHDEVAPGLRWLYRHVPAYSEFQRFCIFWRMGDGALAGVTVDPSWDGEGRSVSMANEIVRQLFTAYIEAEFGDRPDLLAAVLPAYPPGSKRIIRDNGVWASALKRDNVRLVTEGIDRITEGGIRLVGGEEIAADVIVYGTGFTASQFLTPMRVAGRDGRDLHEQWGPDARAYLGVTAPGFPNFFMLYGPNTNIVVNGSIVYFSECGVRHILDLLGRVLAGGHSSVEVRKDVHDEFNERCDAENGRMAWGVSDVNTWYKNERGHIAQNWPFTLLEYWQRTSQTDPDEFVFGSTT